MIQALNCDVIGKFSYLTFETIADRLFDLTFHKRGKGIRGTNAATANQFRNCFLLSEHGIIRDGALRTGHNLFQHFDEMVTQAVDRIRRKEITVVSNAADQSFVAVVQFEIQVNSRDASININLSQVPSAS